MNCKPGDLAYIVNDARAGRIVTVESFVGDMPASIAAGPHWFVTATWEIELRHGMSKRWVFPDSRLRPISGVPVDDEVHDEVLDEVTA